MSSTEWNDGMVKDDEPFNHDVIECGLRVADAWLTEDFGGIVYRAIAARLEAAFRE